VNREIVSRPKLTNLFEIPWLSRMFGNEPLSESLGKAEYWVMSIEYSTVSVSSAVTEKVMEEVEEEDAEPEPEAAPVVPNKPAEQKNKLELEPDKENKKGVEDGGKGRGRPKKVASVSSGKQSSIMNFFTKAK
jgi:hypothetical protein